ncbi:hypothetical protein P170DRAFT_440186 [Aspergillus steynii IBT 23096]|uniref:Uncharacterized protein n=1 Tax=Aspergillus steynii IBT 23096 TaxID=1392250 RepID=A0A2I2FWK5_9EURO|nr:uncharacterized protein P170DRAFT_440186 [Aspergillus steynii IBT 23096]PLB45022.1 hypothetical protein P170DRAFT_440186 [Aspergillus steynii IBT 23096]
MSPSQDGFPLSPDSQIPATTTQEEHHLLHRSLTEKLYMVERAHGVNLHLSNDQTVLDACAGAAVAIIGHGNEEVHQAIIA